jgi:uncharacterized protein with PIN domain
MTVKIVESAPDKSVVKRVVCKYCGVKLEYVSNDVKQKNYTDISGTSDTYYWIDCPNCKKGITVRSI